MARIQINTRDLRTGGPAMTRRPELVAEGPHQGIVRQASVARGGKGPYLRLVILPEDRPDRVVYKNITFVPWALFEMIDFLVSCGADRDELEAMVARGEDLDLDTEDFKDLPVGFDVYHEEYPLGSGRYQDKVSTIFAVAAAESQNPEGWQSVGTSTGDDEADEVTAEIQREIEQAEQAAKEKAA